MNNFWTWVIVPVRVLFMDQIGMFPNYLYWIGILDYLICNEIEKQNPQTAASDEPTEVLRSKRQRVVLLYMQAERPTFTWNRPRLDKKHVVSRTNERNEMWQRSCVNWIPFIATPKGRKEGRRKKWWEVNHEWNVNFLKNSPLGI